MRILEEKLKEELISHLVLPQIEFGANQNDWNLWTMVPHLQIKYQLQELGDHTRV